ncbi:MAG: SAM-dependent methyltransferase [bacterium]
MEKFASRGGEKLQYALNHFNISITGKICADLGSSFGGFTDCLIKNEAKKVYSVDTSYGIFDWKLRNNPKVILLERTNALYLKLPEKVDFISIDVGWTKQKLILPKAMEMLKEKGNIVTLVKPQYEAEQNQRVKGKVEERFLENILENVRTDINKLNIKIKGELKSPILGGKGKNIEYLFWIGF